jgi:hypothetical protein
MRGVKKLFWVPLVLLLALVAGLIYLLPRYDIVLRLKDPLDIQLQGTIPLKADVENQQISVEVQEQLDATVSLDKFGIPLDETIEVPLSMHLSVPIDSDVRIDEPLSLSLSIPIDIVLTEKELDLSYLEIPIDTEVFVDDMVSLDITVPIDSEVDTWFGMTVPVKADLPVKVQVPIRQRLRVQDRLKLQLGEFRIPVSATIPVTTQVHIRQPLRVTGLVEVPVNQTIKVPLKHTLNPDIPDAIPLRIMIESTMPARLKANMDTSIVIDQVFSADISGVRINAGEVRIESATQ